MAWFEDLTPCNYFPADWASFLLAVGWLQNGYPFTSGQVEREVFDKLVEMRKEPWQPVASAGFHGCDLCQYESEARGVSNLFIPGDGVLFVCPELIVHYMNAHRYAPPASFCHAVLACPPMRSMEYFKALLKNGGGRLVRRGTRSLI